MSIRRLFNHVVQVYREPDAQAARDSLGGVASRPVATGPAPTAFNARPNQAWTGSQADRGPGEQQVGRRLWFLDPALDVAERDVLQVLSGPEAGLLLRVHSAVPVSTRRTVHHWECSTEVWVGEVEDYYEAPAPEPEPEPVDLFPGHLVVFNGLVGSLEAKCFACGLDDSIVLGAGNGSVWRSTDDGHHFDQTVANLGAAVNWMIRMADGSLLAGLGNGQLHRSTDNGLTWTLRSTIPAGAVREGALLQTTSGTVLVGANNGHVYRSIDQAQTWTDIGVIGGATNVRELIQLANGRILAGLSLAAPGNSIYYSDNDGVAWTAATPPGVNRTENVMVLRQADDGSVIAHGSSDTDLWRSTDMGATWVVQESGAASGVLILAMAKLPTGTLLTAGTSESSGGPQVRRSTDHGVSFTPTHAGGQIAQRRLTGGENTRAFVLTPVFGAVLVAHQSTRPVWRSVDDGDTWQDPTT